MAVDKKTMWTFMGLVALVVVGLVLVVISMFGERGDSKASDESVRVTIPDGDVQPVADSKSAAMRGAVSLEKYFGELSPDDPEKEVSLVSSSEGASEASSEHRVAESDEAVVARTFGVPPSSPTEVAPVRRSGGSRASRPMSSDERLEYDRKRAEMVREVLTGGATSEEEMPEQVGHDEEKEILRFAQNDSSDGIVSYLDDETSSASEVGVKPFRCMFVRDQKITSGQRVALRLLEDYSDGGVVIPANTHLSAICKIGDRLELSVRSLELGGRIVPLSLEAYDGDGLPGIYCPETASSKASRKASDDAISSAGQTFGGLVGDIASTVLRTGASIAKSASGEVSVSVVSGYEFYLDKVEKR